MIFFGGPRPMGRRRGTIAHHGALICVFSCLGALSFLSCAVGRGEGSVESDDLFVPDCHDGTYSMEPNFFGAENSTDAQFLRIQRGSNVLQNSDGVLISITELEEFADEFIGQDVPIFLSPELVPEGVVVEPAGSGPRVALSLHLGDTCDDEVVSLSAFSGAVTFDAIYTGASGKGPKKERLTEGTFDVLVADPRTLVVDPEAPSGYSSPEASRVTGEFSFYYRKGQPAQTFP